MSRFSLSLALTLLAFPTLAADSGQCPAPAAEPAIGALADTLDGVPSCAPEELARLDAAHEAAAKALLDETWNLRGIYSSAGRLGQSGLFVGVQRDLADGDPRKALLGDWNDRVQKAYDEALVVHLRKKALRRRIDERRDASSGGRADKLEPEARAAEDETMRLVDLLREAEQGRESWASAAGLDEMRYLVIERRIPGRELRYARLVAEERAARLALERCSQPRKSVD